MSRSNDIRPSQYTNVYDKIKLRVYCEQSLLDFLRLKIWDTPAREQLKRKEISIYPMHFLPEDEKTQKKVNVPDEARVHLAKSLKSSFWTFRHRSAMIRVETISTHDHVIRSPQQRICVKRPICWGCFRCCSTRSGQFPPLVHVCFRHCWYLQEGLAWLGTL